MLIQSAAPLPMTSEHVGEALREFVAFAKRHGKTNSHSEFSVSIYESGTKLSEALAKAIPPETNEFYFGMMRAGEPMSAGEFLKAAAKKPKKTSCMVKIRASELTDPLGVLDALSHLISPTGRGVMLMVHLRRWNFIGGKDSPETSLTFSRYAIGSRRVSAAMNISFHALNLKEPVVAQTVSEVAKATGLKFCKPVSSMPSEYDVPGIPDGPAADERLQPPPADQQLVILQTFDEVLGRAADDIAARNEDLRDVPLLLSRFAGFDKRMKDVLAGKKENINLNSRLKKFVTENFPGYALTQTDVEQLWFRKSLAPTLDAMLMFDKFHQMGMGKTFSIVYGIDLPNTKFGGIYAGLGGAQRNIFSLFHEGWETQVWSYSTSDELEVALASCRDVLRRVLPALEGQSLALLAPPPSRPPAGFEVRPPLSAREAYEQILPFVRKWAADAVLQTLAPDALPHLAMRLGGTEPPLDQNGRLRPNGAWALKFLSKTLDRYIYVRVPQAGRIGWDFYSVSQNALPKYDTVIDSNDAWLDSTAIAKKAFDEVLKHADGFIVQSIDLTLHDPRRYTGNVVWEARCLARGKSQSHLRHITVQIDRHSGEVIGHTVR